MFGFFKPPSEIIPVFSCSGMQVLNPAVFSEIPEIPFGVIRGHRSDPENFCFLNLTALWRHQRALKRGEFRNGELKKRQEMVR